MPALFQQVLDAMLTGLTGNAAFINNTIITSETRDELFNHLLSVFKQIQQFGFHIQAEKFPFFPMLIKYLGFIFDKNGCQQDLAHIAAIKSMPAPINVVF